MEASDLADIELTDQAVEVLSQDREVFKGVLSFSARHWLVGQQERFVQSSLFELCFVRPRKLRKRLLSGWLDYCLSPLTREGMDLVGSDC